MHLNYLKNGYHLEYNFLEISEIKNSIKDIFFNYCNKSGNLDETLIKLYQEDINGFIGCAKLCQMLPELINLSVNSKIIETLKKLGLKKPVINTRPLLSFSSKNTAKNEDYWKIPAHQDWPSTQGSLNGITCWMPLVDVNLNLGPLEICKGSHLNGPLPHTKVGSHVNTSVPVLINKEEHEFTSFPMNCNDALFFSNFTVHRSGINLTENKIRISMHFRYDDAYEKTFMQRKYPQHKIETRATGNSLPIFPTNEFNDIFLNQLNIISKTQI